MHAIQSSLPIHVIVVEYNDYFHPGYLPNPWTRTVGSLPGEPVAIPDPGDADGADLVAAPGARPRRHEIAGAHPPGRERNSAVWFVAPRRRVDDRGLRALAQEVKLQGWPGLCLERCQALTPRGLRCLRELPGLRFLSLLNTKVGDDMMYLLEGLPELEWLDLRFNRLTDAGLVHLRHLRKLRFLGLCGNQITGAGLCHIEELTALEELWLGNNRIAPESLVLLQGLPALKTLEVSFMKHTNVALAALGQLRTLEQLQFSGENMTGEGLKHLAGLQRMRHLSMARLRDVGGHLSHLRQLPLETLDLSETELEQRSLSALFGSGVRSLSLKGAQVDDEIFQHVGGLHELRRLRASGLKITNASMPYLALCDRLEELYLNDNNITDLGLWRLSGLRALQRLHLVHLPVSDDVLKSFLGMRELRELDLSCCDIYDHGLAYLAALPHLEWLEMGAYHDYPERPELEEPSLHRLTDDGARHIGVLRGLRRLQLNGTLMTDLGLRHLGGLRRLDFLSLHGLFTGEGLGHLRGLDELRDLLLRSPFLADRHLRHLRHFPRLKCLGLNSTPVGDSGVRRYVSQLKGLRYLDLSSTRVTGTGLESLGTMPALEMVSIRHLDLSPAGLKTVQALTPLFDLNR